MKFWLLFLCCFAFVAWLDSKVLEGNAVKKIRTIGAIRTIRAAGKGKRG